MQRTFGRVKTWPPTAILWARQQAQQEEVVDVSYFQKLQAEFRLRGQEEIPDVSFLPGSQASGGSPTNAPESLSVSVDVPLGDTEKEGAAEDNPALSSLNDETQRSDISPPDSDHQNDHMIDAEPDQSILETLRLETTEGIADGHSDERLEMNITTETIEDPDQSRLNMLRLETTEDMADSNCEGRREMGIATQNPQDPDQSMPSVSRCETAVVGMTDRNNGTKLGMDVATLKTEDELPEPSAARKKSRTGTNQSKRRPRESDKSTTVASPPPKSCSPSDESLLQHNDYVFIDLLHEVVENQGRWTRERWKQTHINRRKFQLKQ
ncbi:uncharacterized protein LOC134088704 [Sardina pilchardus]|uniref:uncharacterized protein LOC134088704 n=1 Tax=Sardina pilchardus TaxID=27697 RepID=UPI002E0D66AB